MPYRHALLAGCLIAPACSTGDGGDGDEVTTAASAVTGNLDASGTSGGDTLTSAGDGDGDGDGDTTTSGDGDSTTSGDGDTTSSGDGDTTTSGDGDGTSDCSTVGQELIDLINAERAAMSLPPVPVSPSMCHVAQTHSQDHFDNDPDAAPECNLHSWSDQGTWSACCYTADHAQAQCMWDKPGELTNYPGNGYEISAGGYSSAADAVAGWMGSSGHRDVILNQGSWTNIEWRAIGGGEVGNNWNVWFGSDDDPGWP